MGIRVFSQQFEYIIKQFCWQAVLTLFGNNAGNLFLSGIDRNLIWTYADRLVIAIVTQIAVKYLVVLYQTQLLQILADGHGTLTSADHQSHRIA